MHHVTKQINGISYTIAHDGDWKGDAIIRYTDSDGSLVEIELPAELLAMCGRSLAYSEVISSIERLPL